MENKEMPKPHTNLLTFLLPFLTFTLALSFISLPSFSAGTGAVTISGDAQKLLIFKATLPNPDALSNWQPDINPCNFTGVSCSDAGDITALDLSRLPLPLSSDFQSVSGNLFTLDHLTSLKLSSANISGELRPIPACSPSITVIDLSLNSVAGSPADLSVFAPCSSLSSLNLSFNHIDSSKGNLVNSPFSLKLKTLDLSGNHLAGNGFLPWILSNGCPQFTNFSIRVSKLEGSFSLNGCDKLQHFDVSHSNFSSEFPKLGLCPQLKHLDLSSNRFSGSIGDEFLSCENLIYLNISGNKFSGPIPAIPTSDLRFLYLSGNGFEGQIHGGRNNNSIVQACPNLVEADLSMNRFSGDLPIGLESCSSLRLFDLSDNRFNGDLPIDVFLKMKNLRKLNLALNRFVGVLPDSISSIASLETLDLSSNSISGEIPVGFCQIQNTQLKELYLQDNLLNGSVPSDLSNCSELVSLDLSFNYLSGSIPPSLGFLSNLKDLILPMNLLEGEIPQQLMYIQTLENLILDYNKLVGPIPSALKNCVNLHWISLSSNHFSGEIPPWLGNLTKLAILKLSNNSFFGKIPPELGNCKSLLWLDLNTNLLNGAIPPSIASQSGKLDNVLDVGMKFAYLKNNGSHLCHGPGNLLEFAGIREESLNRIPTRYSCNFTRVYKGITQPNFQHNGSMLFIDLSYNNLEGEIPKELGSMSKLLILSLAHNQLSGTIPSELQGLNIVGVMDLSYNRLSGEIPPSLASLSQLTEIDLSNNNLSGKIPDSGQFGTFPPSRFYNNSGLCGYQLAPCARNASAAIERRGRRRQRRGTLIGSIAMVLISAFLCIFGVVAAYIELKKRRTGQDLALHNRSESHSNSGNVRWRVPRTREALSINLAVFEKPLRKLTFADLVEASRGFHDDCLIGSGGFGDVYKATLKDGSIVAIKKLIHISGQGDREFTAEMETIGKIKYRNLVPLLGYCKVGEERLLVYEYMAFGSLEDLLHRRKNSPTIKLDWAARRRIAVGTARGLAFLHHNCIPHIIHRDMKSSNVLIDDCMEARVSDFGMARLMSAMDTHLSVSTLAGTPGYVPPEYCQSFRCSAKGDVYSFGVVLLELLSGRRPTDSSDFGENNLVGWVKLHAKMKISDVFDPDLMKEDPRLELELLEHLKVAVACLDDRPSQRPTMLQVMAMFKDIQAAGDGGFDEAAVGGVDERMKEIPEVGKL